MTGDWVETCLKAPLARPRSLPPFFRCQGVSSDTFFTIIFRRTILSYPVSYGLESPPSRRWRALLRGRERPDARAI